MFEIVAAVVGVVLMALFVAGSIRYFRRIGAGRADPLVDPSWTEMMRPSSPPPPGLGYRDGEQDRR